MRVHRVQERGCRSPSPGAAHRGCLRTSRGRVATVPQARPRRGRTPRLVLHLQIVSRAASVPSLAQVRRWARAALKVSAEITVSIVGAAEARVLNRRYRGRDYPPNLLRFPYMARHGMVQGDIVLCYPVIAREALAQGKSLDAHFAHLIVPGLLHLHGHPPSDRRGASHLQTLTKH